jgi:ribosomal protein L24E
MSLPLRWRIACALSSLLAVATLATPAGGAPIVQTITVADAVGDQTPFPELGQGDIVTTTGAYKPAEITFTVKTSIPENPAEAFNWLDPATGIDFFIRTKAAAPAYDYVLHYGFGGGKIYGKVFAANDEARATTLCDAPLAAYSGKTFRVAIEPGCIGKPEKLSYATLMRYKHIDATAPTIDTADNGNFSTDLLRSKVGYWLVGRDGGIFSFGDAPFKGSTGGIKLNQPIVAMAANPVGTGYWFVASDGGVFAFGDAKFFGSTGNIKLNKPIVGMAPTKTGEGYYLVASDGGIFAFGDAKFRGSTGNIKLNKPIVGIAVTPNGRGYWLVASDGGVFAFGNGAQFFGSTGGINLAQPIVGIVPTNSNDGYWFVAADGGIFSFGDARTFTPKLGGSPVTGVAVSPDGDGLWVTRANGEVHGYGSVPTLGSITTPLGAPIVGVAPLEVVSDSVAPAA